MCSLSVGGASPRGFDGVMPFRGLLAHSCRGPDAVRVPIIVDSLSKSPADQDTIMVRQRGAGSRAALDCALGPTALPEHWSAGRGVGWRSLCGVASSMPKPSDTLRRLVAGLARGYLPGRRRGGESRHIQTWPRPPNPRDRPIHISGSADAVTSLRRERPLLRVDGVRSPDVGQAFCAALARLLASWRWSGRRSGGSVRLFRPARVGVSGP